MSGESNGLCSLFHFYFEKDDVTGIVKGPSLINSILGESNVDKSILCTASSRVKFLMN